MSDDDFMQESDEEQFDFESGSDEQGDDVVDIENKYYNGKQMKEEFPEEAISEFLEIPKLEEEKEKKGEWGFKALKQAVKMELKLGRYDDALEHYRELLTYVKSAVTRNYSEKSINNMLDYTEKTLTSGSPSTSSGDSTAAKYMQQFYSHTLQSFQSTNNERLWLKTNLKLARLFLEKRDYSSLLPKVRELHKACELPDGTEDPNKGTYSLEVYSMEIQMYADTKNNAKLKEIYPRALRIKTAVTHPRVMGVIRECGGKMHMSEENWSEAQSDFFESFRNYDEAGVPQRYQVLKYLVLTTMLMKSDINPFESQETKPYRNDPRISAMTDLVDAYQRDDIRRYEEVLKKNPDILHDAFIAENIDEVTRNMRMKAVLKLIAPYTRFKVSAIARQLRIPEQEVQDILGYLIIDGKVKGRINQAEGSMEIMDSSDEERLKAVRKLGEAVEKLVKDVIEEGEGFMLMGKDTEKGGAGDVGGVSGFLGSPVVGGEYELRGGGLGGGMGGRGGGGKLMGVGQKRRGN